VAKRFSFLEDSVFFEVKFLKIFGLLNIGIGEHLKKKDINIEGVK